MNPEIEKKIKQQFEELPKIIQDLISGPEWRMWVANIVKKNALNLDQATTLEQQIFMFLIGVLGIPDLRKDIEKELRVPPSKVNEIMIDINNMIVDPLKQKLINSTANSNEESVLEKAPAPIKESIALKEKEEEILDRQKVLREIEEAAHAPGVGVYVPNEKGNAVPSYERGIQKIQPIAQNAQIGSVASKPALQNVASVPKATQAAPAQNTFVNPAQTSPVSQPPRPASDALAMLKQEIPVQKPASIFEAKTSAVVAPQPARSTAVVSENKPLSKPAPESKPAASRVDPYREPIS